MRKHGIFLTMLVLALAFVGCNTGTTNNGSTGRTKFSGKWIKGSELQLVDDGVTLMELLLNGNVAGVYNLFRWCRGRDNAPKVRTVSNTVIGYSHQSRG